MKFNTSVLFLITLAPAPSQVDVPAPKSSVTFSYARGNVVYGLAPNAAAPNRIVSVAADGKVTAKYLVIAKPRTGVLCRWRVTPDAVWLAQNKGGADNHMMRAPIEDLPFFDESDPGRDKKMMKKYAGDPDAVCFPHHWSLDPATQAVVWRGRGGFPPQDKHLVNFDVLPQDKDSGLLFFQEEMEMSVWAGKAGKWKLGVGNFGVSYKLVERFEVTFTDQFFVMPHGDDYLFLTAGGELHLADRSDGGFRTTRPVWRNKKEPTGLVVSDVDSGTVGLFTCSPYEPELCLTYFTLSKGKVTQQFRTEALGKHDGIADPKLAIELLGKYVRPKK